MLNEGMAHIPTTDEYWEVDGLVLNTLAWNISSWGNGRRGVPKLRGENVTLPNRPGEVWVPKIPEAGGITLGMWVRGCESDGSVARNRQGQFNHNWQTLYRHLWRSDRQVVLTRRTKQYDGSVFTDQALAEFTGGLEPDMQGPQGAAFTVDFKLADPYFYGPTVTERLTAGTAVIDNDSDDTLRKLNLTFTEAGPYTLTNETTGKTFTVNATGTVKVDTDLFTAVDDAGVSVIGDVVSNFQQGSFWMSLVRGENVMTLNDGVCRMEWKTIRL